MVSAMRGKTCAADDLFSRICSELSVEFARPQSSRQIGAQLELEPYEPPEAGTPYRGPRSQADGKG
jgi:hypothetical protein